MVSLLEGLQEFFEENEEYSQFQRALLAVHLQRICVPLLYALGFFTIGYLLIAGQVGAFFFPSREEFLFNQWRFIVSVLMVWMILVLSVSRSFRRKYHWAFTAVYLPAVFFSGYYLPQLTEPNAAVMYVLYLMPFFTLVLPGGLRERTLVTFGSYMSFLGIYLARGWDMNLYVGVGLIMGCSVFISIIVGHFAVYRMNRSNFFQSRELEEKKIRIEELAMFDQLTGLYERHELDKRLEEEYDRARRHEQKFSVLMIDLDDFKEINDTYGHDVGDTVLERVGTILEEVVENELRSSDVAGRYGGEEFCIMLPTADQGGAKNVAERIRKNLRDVRFDTGEGDTFQVTCSIGVAELNQGVHTPEELVQRADEALYAAKEAGRDQVKIYSELGTESDS